MDDLKEKLDRIRKERRARSRSREVFETWEKLQEEGELSTKEKLERLIRLTGERKARGPAAPPFEPLPREPLQFTENGFPLEARYGRVKIASGLEIGGDVLSCLSQDEGFRDLDLSTALFIDLETTGLSGGTGVVPFNVGLGYYRGDRFVVAQYFLGELADEGRMIQELARFFQEMDFRSVVTFNGKGFDIPLLETRFILHRQPFRLGSLPHLDFLFAARRLWSHKLESCRLYHLALEVVRADRSEDIPSAEIPWRYFQYLKTGNRELVEPILYHNQEDILSLLAVVILGARIFSDREEACTGDAMDFFGAGKVLERMGDEEGAVRFFQRALSGRLPDEVSLEARRRLSLHFKRRGEWEKAVPIWKEMAASRLLTTAQLFSFRELAMYLEHRMKDFEEARKVAEEGYILAMGNSTAYERDFSYRLERLKRKLKRAEGIPEPDAAKKEE